MVQPKLEKYLRYSEKDPFSFRRTAERKIYEDALVLAERWDTEDLFEEAFGHYLYNVFMSLLRTHGSEKEKYLWVKAGFFQQVRLSLSAGVIAELQIQKKTLDELGKEEKYLKGGWIIRHEFLNITEVFQKITGIPLNIVNEYKLEERLALPPFY